jgi:hypothetical protein
MSASWEDLDIMVSGEENRNIRFMDIEMMGSNHGGALVSSYTFSTVLNKEGEIPKPVFVSSPCVSPPHA